ncbi:copper chaperone NosL [Algoriphagus halophilus]|uniref:Copper chaperone NosL n=2 Tax=Algoriphagus halophilus TaxID=226505 RepID=A0A1N6EFT5_9BACT|nr:copper chaperone NosL [Algoriphagus halophilus]
MLFAAILMGSVFVFPLWNITLEAPQYPEPLGMDIYINKFHGVNDNDIKNINIMNHYVGMKEIPEVIPEFSIFPYVVGGMVLLGLILALVGKRNLYLVWFCLMLIFGAIGMYDFYQWEYEYGHELADKAPIKFTDEDGNPMSYQPPLIGAKTILNFRAISLPKVGAYLMGAAMGLSLLAFFIGKNRGTGINAAFLMLLPLSLTLNSCDIKPEDIHYGKDFCQFCRMTIVDQQHAAQLVTQKGRAYKYDAIECMVNDLKDWERPEVELLLVADYEQPGTLIEAKKASYLISDQIPSPMGANLSAFSSTNSRDKIYQTMGGSQLDWHQLQTDTRLKANSNP